MAFGISEDDVYTVLLNKDVPNVTDALARSLFEELNQGAVQSAALDGGEDLDEQTIAAYNEIWRQVEGSNTLAEYFSQERAKALRVLLPSSSQGPKPPRF